MLALYFAFHTSEWEPAFAKEQRVKVTHRLIAPFLLAAVRDPASDKVLFYYDLDHGPIPEDVY